jgi:hypothetical protein
LKKEVAVMAEDALRPTPREEQLSNALRRAILLRETGPKSAAWHRARMQTIWRLHRLLAEAGQGKPQP